MAWHGVCRYHNLEAIPFLWICMSERVCVPTAGASSKIDFVIGVCVCARLFGSWQSHSACARSHKTAITHTHPLRPNSDATFFAFIDFFVTLSIFDQFNARVTFSTFSPMCERIMGKWHLALIEKRQPKWYHVNFGRQAIACQLRSSISICRTGTAVYCVIVSWAVWKHRTKTIIPSKYWLLIHNRDDNISKWAHRLDMCSRHYSHKKPNKSGTDKRLRWCVRTDVYLA